MSSTLIPKRLLEPISFSIGQFASCFYIKSEKWIPEFFALVLKCWISLKIFLIRDFAFLCFIGNMLL